MKKKTYITAIALIVSSFSFSGQAFSANESSSMLAKLSPENSGGTFKYSTDTNISSEQKKVYDTIIKYQTALNAGDTKTILGLFANESYSQWNDMLTADSTEKRKVQYDNLFQREKFETEFAFDSIWINGNTAVVRTHHHIGSVVTNFKDQKTVIDLNREVFVLSKVNGEWKIFLYTFNTNPLQGSA